MTLVGRGPFERAYDIEAMSQSVNSIWTPITERNRSSSSTHLTDSFLSNIRRSINLTTKDVATFLVVMERLLTTKQVCGLVSLSRQEIWRRRRLGSFPRPVRIGPRRVGYRAEEIQAWLDALRAERDGQSESEGGQRD